MMPVETKLIVTCEGCRNVIDADLNPGVAVRGGIFVVNADNSRGYDSREIVGDTKTKMIEFWHISCLSQKLTVETTAYQIAKEHNDAVFGNDSVMHNEKG